MLELIVIIIFLVSLFGMAVIALSKIPTLKELEVRKKPKARSFLQVVKKIKHDLFLRYKKFTTSDAWNAFLQRALSKIKIFSLKIEAKCSRLLESMREKTVKSKQDQKYWEKMSKISLKKKKKK